MIRRKLLASGGASFCIALAGCLGTIGGSGEYGGDPGRADGRGGSNDDEVNESRIEVCEEQYIRNEVITRDDETIVDPVEPEIVDVEPRSDGVYVETQTRFGTTRSSKDAPDEHVDHLVTAYYLVSDEEVYRTEDAEGDPRDGTPVDC